MVWCTISDLSDTSGPTPAGRQERQATKRSEKHWQNLTLLAHATCQSTSHAQVALDICHMSQRAQAQWNSHIKESRMNTPHKGSSCSVCGSYGRKITSWFPSEAHLQSTCMLTLKESIPHTALTEATLVGKQLHSRFSLTGLTGLTGLTRSWTWLLCKVGTRTRLRTPTPNEEQTLCCVARNQLLHQLGAKVPGHSSAQHFGGVCIITVSQ